MLDRYERQEFEGEVIWAVDECTPAQFYIEVDKLSYGKVKGHFYCNDFKLFDKYVGRYFTIKPKFKIQYGSTVELRKCSITKNMGSLEVAKYYFNCLEYVDITNREVKGTLIPRKLSMFFYHNYYPDFTPPKLFHCDLNETPPANKELALLTLNNIEIGVYLARNNTEYSIDSIEGNFEDVEQILSITLLNEDQSKKVNELVTECKELVQSLLVLFSFYSGKRIYHYRYSYITENIDGEIIDAQNVIIGHNKRVRYEGDVDYHGGYDAFKNFIQLTFPVYLEKKIDYKLNEAIHGYISSFEAKTIESSFTHLCTSIEALKDGYYELNRETFVLNRKTFGKLENYLIKQINIFATDNELDSFKVNNIIKKLPDLKRPSFKVLLKHMLNNLNVRINDLGDNDVFDFVPIRHELLHSGKVKGGDYMQLIIERNKLRPLIGRIILRILEYPVGKSYIDRIIGKNS